MATSERVVEKVHSNKGNDDTYLCEKDGDEKLEGHPRCSQANGSKVEERVFDGAFGGVGDEEVVVGGGVVVTSSSLEMLTNGCVGGIMVNLIFLEEFEEEALVEFMVEFG
ncbi:hypothetical protein Tco_0816137 [Tanacetum coccineum]